MTRLEIIKDTVEFYSEDPKGRRSIDENDNCVYTDQHGCHCAVGRYLKTEYQYFEWEHNKKSAADDLYPHFYKDDIPQDIRKDYRFWQDLQVFHDDNLNFDEDGLSEIGKEEAEQLINKYS